MIDRVWAPFSDCDPKLTFLAITVGRSSFSAVLKSCLIQSFELLHHQILFLNPVPPVTGGHNNIEFCNLFYYIPRNDLRPKHHLKLHLRINYCSVLVPFFSKADLHSGQTSVSLYKYSASSAVSKVWMI